MTPEILNYIIEAFRGHTATDVKLADSLEHVSQVVIGLCAEVTKLKERLSELEQTIGHRN